MFSSPLTADETITSSPWIFALPFRQGEHAEQMFVAWIRSRRSCRFPQAMASEPLPSTILNLHDEVAILLNREMQF